MPWGIFVCHNDKAKEVYGVVARRRTADGIKEKMDAQGHWCGVNREGKLDLVQIRVERVAWKDIHPRNPFRR